MKSKIEANEDFSRFRITLEKGEDGYSFASDRYPDGGFTFSELLMIERIQDACDRLLNKECDFEGACEFLSLIGWDEEKRIATVLPQHEVDEVVQLIRISGDPSLKLKLNEGDR